MIAAVMMAFGHLMESLMVLDRERELRWSFDGIGAYSAKAAQMMMATCFEFDEGLQMVECDGLHKVC